jgi:CheY-like chemotaxis protein
MIEVPIVATVVTIRPRPLHILVVDDSESNRVLACRMLVSLGMVTAQATDGPSALQHVDDHPCDLVFLDVNMPRMSGYETAKQLIAKPMRPRIIAMTAHAGDADRELCTSAGMDDYLSKPFRLSTLRQVLMRQSVVTVLDEQPLRDLGDDGLLSMRPMVACGRP